VADLTIAVDDGTSKKARMHAFEEDTSVNAILWDYLEECTIGGPEQVEVARRIVAASRESVSGSGLGGWKREDAYGDCVR
jgi:hypothetical protein